MYSVLKSYGLNGLNGFAVAVEADVSGGLPAFSLVGLPDSAVRESGDRVHAAARNLGFKWPDRRITVNVSDEAKQWLDERGYDSTLDYVRAMAIRVLEETGLLPHLNPGVMSWSELSRLKPVAPSMGMMLETTSRRLYETKGLAHYGSPDKDPLVRLQVLRDAGAAKVPFTTGILVGIGENLTERAQSLLAMAQIHRTYGHIQEVIVQNFRAKPDTAMRGVPDAEMSEFLSAVAVARLVMGPDVAIQAPPNLVSHEECAALIASGIADWGGVSPLTPDHVNPERPWPNLDTLADLTSRCGFTLTERITAEPQYVLDRGRWIDAALTAHVEALADPVTGLAVDTRPVGRSLPRQPVAGLP